MKTPLFITFIAIVVFGAVSCDKVAPSFCDKEVDLGEFSTTVELPYDSFKYVLLLSENGDTAGLSINHPSVLSGGEMHYHLKSVTEYTSDCQELRSLEKYTWSVRDKRGLVLIAVPDNYPFILMKAVPIFDETKPQIGPIVQYLQFFKQQAGNVIEATDFMSIMVEETEAGAGQGKALEHGYLFTEEMVIGGKSFKGVYTNEKDLGIGIQNFYFTMEAGIVGVKDNEGVMWSLED